mmetsp:Transcript_27704/g.42164  ORF Transcript_27704/g.42164 Transcript_27704/m.42164 type:complete len:186 (+) Transcript_27704:2160-2717(+)
MEEREAEAAERAEEERIRQAVAKGELSARDGAQQSNSKAETVETVRVVHRRQTARRDMDMELPFFDEGDASHAQSHVEAMRQQRATFERQQRDRKTLRKLSLSTGALLFSRHIQSGQAKKWLESTGKAINSKVDTQVEPKENKDVASKLGSLVANELGKAGRTQIKLRPKKMLKKRKHTTSFSFE